MGFRVVPSPGMGATAAVYNVVDPVRSVVAIENYMFGTSQVAQTTLRSIIGQADLDDLLVKRDEINQQLQQIFDTHPAAIGNGKGNL